MSETIKPVADKYTNTRISKRYRAKLNKLAKKNKRSAMAHLEYLIDQDEKKQ